MYINGFRTSHCTLGYLPGTGNLYVCLKTHSAATHVDGLLLFRYVGAIIFTRANHFKRAVLADIESSLPARNLHTVVLDLGCVTQIDVTGLQAMYALQSELRTQGVNFVLAAPNDRVKATIRHGIELQWGTLVVFVSLHDAVVVCVHETIKTD